MDSCTTHHWLPVFLQEKEKTRVDGSHHKLIHGLVWICSFAREDAMSIDEMPEKSVIVMLGLRQRASKCVADQL